MSECFRGPHLQPTPLSDKVGILAVSVSCSPVFKFGVFLHFEDSYSVPLRAHGSRPFCVDFTHAVNVYAHV